jgi:peroxiredoxin
VKLVAYGVASALGALLVTLFARALPDFAARARDGDHRGREIACEALQPAPGNPALGAFPRPAPDFTLKDWQGHDVSLSSFRGNVVLVNFWATWCKTCVVEIPSMEKMVSRMRGRPFRLLAVSVDDDWPEIRRFFANGTSIDVLLDSSRTTPKSWGTEKFPESFLIDKNGVIRYYVISDRDWTQPEIAACLDAMMD